MQHLLNYDAPYSYRRAGYPERPQHHYSTLKIRTRKRATPAYLSPAQYARWRYRQNPELHHKRKDLQPDHRLSEELTEARRQTVVRQGKPAPKPSVVQTPSAKGKAAVTSAMGGAAASICKLIFVSRPGGKMEIMYGRYTCMDSECFAGEPKPT